MSKLMRKQKKTTFITKEQALKGKKYYIFDASKKVLGRFASEIAKVLRGKHKVDFTPNADTGDGVFVVNSDKIEISGAKRGQKVYKRFTGFLGGLKETNFKDMEPEDVIFLAVKGMMPKTKLSKHQLKRLRFKVDETKKPIKLNI